MVQVGKSGCFSLAASTSFWFGVVAHGEVDDLGLDLGFSLDGY